MQPARAHSEPLDRARRDLGAQILGVDGERLQRPPEPVIVQQRRRDPQQFVDRRTRRPARDVIQRRRRAQPTRDQRAHDLTDRQDRPGAARQRAVDRVLDLSSRRKCSTSSNGPTLRRVPAIGGSKPRERSRQRLQLPRVLQRILPAKVCHNTMANLAALVTVPLDQLQVAVLAARPLHFRFLDEQVATTLHAPPDRTTASTDPQLPQHDPTPRHKEPRNPPPRLAIRRTTHPQPRKMGLAQLMGPPNAGQKGIPDGDGAAHRSEEGPDRADKEDGVEVHVDLFHSVGAGARPERRSGRSTAPGRTRG